jgi:hypothetical protein
MPPQGRRESSFLFGLHRWELEEERGRFRMPAERD